jgi:hypothetical protein
MAKAETKATKGHKLSGLALARPEGDKAGRQEREDGNAGS